MSSDSGRSDAETQAGGGKRNAIKKVWSFIEPSLHVLLPGLGYGLIFLAACSGPGTFWYALIGGRYPLAFGGRGYCPQHDSK